MKEQQERSQVTSKGKKGIKLKPNNVKYVEYRTFKQEAATAISKFSIHFSNQKNVERMKRNVCAFIDDLADNARVIRRAKSSGIGFGVISILFPKATRAINSKDEKENNENANKT